MATEHNLIPEIKAYLAKARLKRGIEMIKLANRIEALKMQEEDEEEATSPHPDIPRGGDALRTAASGEAGSTKESSKSRLSRAAKSAIFKEVVLAKVREMRMEEEKAKVQTGTIKPT